MQIILILLSSADDDDDDETNDGVYGLNFDDALQLLFQRRNAGS